MDGLCRCRFWTFLAALLVATSLQIEPTKADPAADPAPPLAVAMADQSTIEDVVVTARRHQELARDVPLPLSVFGGEDLTVEGTHRFEQLQEELPDTSVVFFNPRQANISIRGLGFDPAADGLESSVGLFVDGVYYGRPGMEVADYVDLDQVELLRGPQGTLFGKNTTAGAFNITTAKPSFTPQAIGELTIGDDNLRQMKATLTGPILGGEAAVRLTAYSDKQDGFVQNIEGGSANDTSREGGRLQLLVLPTETMTVRLIADYAYDNENCCVPILASKGPDAPATGFDHLAALVGYTPLFDPSGDKTDINSREQIRTRQGGVSGEADWDLGFAVLSSITAFRDWDFVPWNDFDFTGMSLLTQSGARTKDDQISQEVRLVSPSGGRLDWVAGVFLFRQQLHDLLTNTYGADAGNALANIARTRTNLSGALNGFSSLNADSVHTGSAAGYVNATLRLGDGWSVSAGLRDTDEEKYAFAQGWAAGGGAAPAAILAPVYARLRSSVAPVFVESESVADNALSGSVNPAYQISDDVLLYALYSRGYKSAGLNTTLVPADDMIIHPESVDDIEMGFKATAPDRHWEVNTDAFWELAWNYQGSLLNFTTNQGYLANVGAIRTAGVETDVAYLPAPGLALKATGSFDSAIYRSFHDAPCPAETAMSTCDLTGQRVVLAPRWTGDFSANYTLAVTDTVAVYAIADYSVRSGAYGSGDESIYGWIPAYGIANVRLGFRQDGVDVSLWARNLANTRYYSSVVRGLLTNGAYFGVLGEPLTVGATLRVAW